MVSAGGEVAVSVVAPGDGGFAVCEGWVFDEGVSDGEICDPLILLLFTLILSACIPRGSVRNPMQDTQQMLFRDFPEALDKRVLGMRQTPEGEVVVIYTYRMPPKGDDSGSYFTGVAAYRRTPSGAWEQSGGGGAGSSQPPAPDQLLDYFTVGGGTTSTAIYGQVLSSTVSAVEGELSSGETVREEAGDRAFVIFAPTGAKVCRLNVLGTNGEVLRVNDFVSDEAGDPCR